MGYPTTLCRLLFYNSHCWSFCGLPDNALDTQLKRGINAINTHKKKPFESEMIASTALFGRCLNRAKWKVTCLNAVDAQLGARWRCISITNDSERSLCMRNRLITMSTAIMGAFDWTNSSNSRILLVHLQRMWIKGQMLL